MKNSYNLKFIAVLITILLAVYSIVSCSKQGNTSDTQMSTEPLSTKTEIPHYQADYLPHVSYNGSDFKIIAYDEYPAHMEEETGSPINDAIYRRNQLVEEQYDIQFIETRYPYTQYGDVFALMERNALAQADDYDLYTLVFRHAFWGVMNGEVVPASYFPISDFSQPWYLQHLNENIIIKDLQVIAYSAFDKNPGGYSILFNKKLITDMNMAVPYQMVDDGTWTYDVLLRMAETAIMDVDGDGIMTVADRYGFISEPDNMADLMYQGSGYKMMDFSDDMPKLANYEQIYTLFNTFNSYITKTGFYFNTFDFFGASEDSRIKGLDMFISGGAFFMATGTNRLTLLGNMEDDYGIVPFPKWTEKQENYYVGIDGSRIAVPLTCTADLERVCVVKEALAVESLNINYPTYYEISLKNRYVRDTESVRMLEIITNSNSFDLGCSLWNDLVRGPWQNNLNKSQSNIASEIEQNQKKLDKEIEKLMENVENIKL